MLLFPMLLEFKKIARAFKIFAVLVVNHAKGDVLFLMSLLLLNDFPFTEGDEISAASAAPHTTGFLDWICHCVPLTKRL